MTFDLQGLLTAATLSSLGNEAFLSTTHFLSHAVAVLLGVKEKVLGGEVVSIFEEITTRAAASLVPRSATGETSSLFLAYLVRPSGSQWKEGLHQLLTDGMQPSVVKGGLASFKRCAGESFLPSTA